MGRFAKQKKKFIIERFQILIFMFRLFSHNMVLKNSPIDLPLEVLVADQPTVLSRRGFLKGLLVSTAMDYLKQPQLTFAEQQKEWYH